MTLIIYLQFFNFCDFANFYLHNAGTKRWQAIPNTTAVINTYQNRLCIFLSSEETSGEKMIFILKHVVFDILHCNAILR